MRIGRPLLAACGMARVGADARRLRRIGIAALSLFALQVAFVVAIRPIAPMWMVSSCVPPLAFAIAVGFNAWLSDPRAGLRRVGAIAIGAYLLLALALFPMDVARQPFAALDGECQSTARCRRKQRSRRRGGVGVLSGTPARPAGIPVMRTARIARQARAGRAVVVRLDDSQCLRALAGADSLRRRCRSREALGRLSPRPRRHPA